MTALQTLQWEMEILQKKQKSLEDENGYITNVAKYVELTKTLVDIRKSIEFFQQLNTKDVSNV
mgnify:FL=1